MLYMVYKIEIDFIINYFDKALIEIYPRLLLECFPRITGVWRIVEVTEGNFISRLLETLLLWWRLS